MFSSSFRRCGIVAFVALALLALAAESRVNAAVAISSTLSTSSYDPSATAVLDALRNNPDTANFRQPRVHVVKVDPAVVREAESLAAAQSGSITIVLMSPDFTLLNRPAYNTTCRSSNGTVYTPNLVSIAYPIALFNRLEEGEYECTVDQLGFYRFSDRIVLNSTRPSAARYFNLLPVSYGVTFVYNILSASGTGIGFFPNMTFPSGAFNFRYASAMAAGGGAQTDYNFGLKGPIPARYRWGPWLSELQSATAGVYHYTVETFHLPPNPLYPNGYDMGFNFLNGSQSVSIFAGNDQHNGFKGIFYSQIRDAKTWVVGSLTVSNPSSGCSRYSWHFADTYMSTWGFNPNAPATGAGDLILEECFDASPAALQCAKKIYEEDVEVSTCGAFGDPHIVMFNGTGVTCGRDTAITLVDNDWFSLVGLTTIVSGAPATTLRSVTFTYKGSCNPATITFNDLGAISELSIPNSPIALRHRVRLVGNNIYVDAIRLRVQVRAIEDDSGWPTLVFGVSMPKDIVASSTGVCSASCPPGTLVTIDSDRRKRDPARAAMALAACEDAGLTGSSFEREACLFDVETTGDANYAQVASTSRTVKNDVSQPWKNDDSNNASTMSAAFAIILSVVIASVFVLF